MFELNLMTLLLGGGGILLLVALLLYAKRQSYEANELLKKATDRWKNTKRDIEAERREALLKIKDEIFKKRNEFDLEIKREWVELERLQAKLNSKFEVIEKKELNIDEVRRELQQKERAVSRTEVYDPR